MLLDFFDKFGYIQVASADSIYVSKRTAEENKFYPSKKEKGQ